MFPPVPEVLSGQNKHRGPALRTRPAKAKAWKVVLGGPCQNWGEVKGSHFWDPLQPRRC